jgi:hypothetical protein
MSTVKIEEVPTTISKGEVKLTEYSSLDPGNATRFFLKAGVAGLYLRTDDLFDLYDLLVYYFHNEGFDGIKVAVEGEDVAI